MPTFSFLYQMEPLIVSQLFIYPVKSLGGIAVASATVLPKGLAYDRRWMLVDESNRFLTQRNFPQLALFKLAFSDVGNRLLVHFADESVLLPAGDGGDSFRAEIWDDVVEVTEPDSGISQWFSEKLEITCKLVAFPEANKRPVDPGYAVNPADQTSLSDGYPILVIGQSSLDDLNGRLADPIGADRFRPNIVFTGGKPFEEDSWKRFSIAKVPMAGVKPCARCTVPTINQQTGVAGKEPLATLNSYRKVGNKVLFGQNVIPLGQGTICTGDEIVPG
jgi:hypothetical protein